MTEGPTAGTGTATDARSATRSQVRGSTIMLVGRVASLGLTFLTQVLAVRYLSKGDFGALAYALSAVAFVQPFLALGLDLADTRFFALYDERGQRSRLAGLLVLESTTILGLGLVLVAGSVLLHGQLVGWLTDDADSVDLLVLLIATAPLQAIDAVVLDLFAVFANARAVFVRRFVLSPGLRLVALLVVMSAHLDVRALALGYLAASAAGSLVFLPLTARLLARTGVLEPLRGRRVEVPARETLAFGLPLLSTSLVLTLSTTLGALVLGSVGTAAQVAAFRAVQPVAVLVMLVQTSFAILFQPAAARLFARQDVSGLSDLYWHTSGWLTVLTFPLGALAICFADPVVTTLFGARYAGSAPYLVILAVASYIQSATGFNGAVLQVVGRVRYLVVGNVAVASLSVVANVLLIRQWGALGAAWATAGTMVAHNVVKQAGLPGAGIAPVERSAGAVFAWSLGALLALATFQQIVDVPLVAAVPLVAVASLALLRVTRHQLDLSATFPELARLRPLRRLLGQ